MKVILTFGPDASYLMGTETKWKSRGLSEAVTGCLSQVNRIHALALAPDGAFIFCGESSDGKIVNVEHSLSARFPRLSRWHAEMIRLTPNLLIHDVSIGMSSQCSNKSADCFWVASSDSLRWSGVHEDFQWAVQYQLSLNGWHRQPRSASFGVNRSFVIVWEDGVVNYRLKGYDKLLGILDFSREVNPRNIAYVSLNPYKEAEFFIAFHDGSTHWSLPRSWEMDILEVARDYREGCRREAIEHAQMHDPLYHTPMQASNAREYTRRTTYPYAAGYTGRDSLSRVKSGGMMSMDEEGVAPHIVHAETEMMRPKTREYVRQKWQDMQEQYADGRLVRAASMNP